MRTSTTLSIALSATLLLAGCASGDDAPDGNETPTASPSPDASPEPSASPDASPEPTPSSTVTPVEAPLTTDPSSAPANGDPVAVTDVELSSYDGFDRIVLTIGGDGEAGWDVRYEDDPRAPGSGRPVEVAGTAVLTVEVTGVALPPDAPVPVYDGPERLESSSTAAIAEVLDGTVFEGVHTFHVGVAERLPYRIERRESPQRLVLEVPTP